MTSFSKNTVVPLGYTAPARKRGWIATVHAFDNSLPEMKVFSLRDVREFFTRS